MRSNTLTRVSNNPGAVQILGEVPEFGWVMEQLQRAEAAINPA